MGEKEEQDNLESGGRAASLIDMERKKGVELLGEKSAHGEVVEEEEVIVVVVVVVEEAWRGREWWFLTGDADEGGDGLEKSDNKGFHISGEGLGLATMLEMEDEERETG